MSPAEKPFRIPRAGLNIRVAILRRVIPVQETAVIRLARSVLLSEGRLKGELSISFVGKPLMRSLNKTYHGRDCLTDVLSFDLSDGSDIIQADIYVSPDAAVSSSRVFGTSRRAELALYVIHGILHLCGYDDGSAREQKAMRQRETEYLEKLNGPDPKKA